MNRRTVCTFGLLVLLVSVLLSVHDRATAQASAATRKKAATHDELKPLDPNDPRLTFSFSIQPDGKPFHFRVGLNDTGNITGVSVFREGNSEPLQTLQSCEKVEFTDEVTDGWQQYEIDMLINHADLKFDGFEDLELLQNYIPHLDKKLYCIYLWDNKAGRYSYSKELSNDIGANLEAHHENKTLTTREDWFGGPWQYNVYHWRNDKLELIEQNSLLGDWSMQKDGKCGWEYSCSRLVNGKMVTILEKPVCTPEEMSNLPECPAASTSPASKEPVKAPQL